MGHFVEGIVYWLAHPFFEFVVLPVLITFLAVLFKCIVRGAAGPKLELTREDLLFGFDLGVTALLTLVASTVKAGERFRSLQAELQRTDGANTPELTTALSTRSREALDYLVAAPTFTFAVFVTLLGLALFASQNGWEGSGSTRRLRKPWIFACDVLGFLFLVGALALGGLIR